MSCLCLPGEWQMINPAEMANIAKAEESLWWFRGMRQIAFALLDPIRKGARVERILEAGCGTGHFAIELRKRYAAQVAAVDLEPEAMRFCRRLGVPNPARTSVASLPFPNETFDLVTSMDVLPHFAPGEEATPFAEMVRVLRPGGFLFLRAAALRLFRSRHSQYVWESQRFTKAHLKQLAQAHHLRILRLTYVNFLLSPVAFLKFRVYEPLT